MLKILSTLLGTTVVLTLQFNPDGSVRGNLLQEGVIMPFTWLFRPLRVLDDGGTGVGAHKIWFRDRGSYLRHKVNKRDL